MADKLLWGVKNGEVDNVKEMLSKVSDLIFTNDKSL